MDKWEAKYAPVVLETLRDAGADDLAVKLAFCTIRTESDWHNYTNIRVPESFNYPNDGRPPNYESEQTQLSVGLYQQQVQFWGGAARCMDPVRASLSWYRGIPEIGVPGLLTLKQGDYHALRPWHACQAVQGSQFSSGSNYEDDWPDAIRLFDEINGEDVLDVALTRDDLKSAFTEALQGIVQSLKGISDNAGEARRIAGVAAGALPAAGNEKSVTDQIFQHRMQIHGDWPYENFLIELNKKVDLLVARSSEAAAPDGE